MSKKLKQIVAYVQPELYEKIKQKAERDRRSLSFVVAEVLEKWAEKSVN